MRNYRNHSFVSQRNDSHMSIRSARSNSSSASSSDHELDEDYSARCIVGGQFRSREVYELPEFQDAWKTDFGYNHRMRYAKGTEDDVKYFVEYLYKYNHVNNLVNNTATLIELQTKAAQC